jgi:hypothetical protein
MDELKASIKTERSVGAGLGLAPVWGPIFGGALAGFATMALMAALGAALGVSVTAAAIHDNDANATSARGIAAGLSLGALAWLLASAIVVGLVAGRVLARLARHDVVYRPGLFGVLTWATGMLIVSVLATIGGSGMASGMIGAGGDAAAVAMQYRLGLRDPGAAGRTSATTSATERTSPSAAGTEQTPEERTRVQDAADKAAKAATVFAWTGFVSMLLSLGATVFAARRPVTTTRYERAPAPGPAPA